MKSLILLIIMLVASICVVYPDNNHLLKWSNTQWLLDSKDVNTTWVDDNGFLHLTIQNESNNFVGTYFENTGNVKYGITKWTVHSPSLNLDRNTSVGLFIYHNDSSEIDIELNQWPGYDQHLWFTNQPGNVDNYPENLNYTVLSNNPHLNDTDITYTIDWEPTYITFSAINKSGVVINSWKYTNTSTGKVPGVNSTICMDLGCLPDKHPASGNGAEIVISNYSYTPYSPNITNNTVPILPIANFSSSSTAHVNTAVKFTDSSKYANKWTWGFGDGTTSTLQSPTHAYKKVGTYQVTLTASNAYGSNKIVKTLKVIT